MRNQLVSSYTLRCCRSYGDKPRRAESFKIQNLFILASLRASSASGGYREKSRAFGTRDPPLQHARLPLLNTRNEELARRLYARIHSFLSDKTNDKVSWEDHVITN